MTVQTGANGQLKYRNKVIAKVTNFAVNASKDALEDTCIGSYDRTYIQGLRGSSGSATVLYDPNDEAANELLNSIFKDGESSSSVQFIVSSGNTRGLTYNGFLTGVGVAVAVGATTGCDVQFTLSGKAIGGF